eukprot:CAMPEP_0184497128 /NCGR_PEP_ID=MMETSP0113_2-20130426/35757_1 /TAXON_ID=91329 /ORGANISM="Norrisiella sphaerica, Strain BC52" /LENGTH=86 /DNA_ID=CAMNT_0026884105 /DNA_START=183 /DNA_END=440 /DNA_ORIENTATION=-
MASSDLTNVASRLLTYMQTERFPEDEEGCFRGSRAVKFFLESGFARGHKEAVALGKKLIRAGFARRLSGDATVVFEGTDDARYVLI